MSDIIALIASYWWLWIIIAAVNSIVAVAFVIRKQSKAFSAFFRFDFGNFFVSVVDMFKSRSIFFIFAAIDTICGALLLISILHYVIAYMS